MLRRKKIKLRNFFNVVFTILWLLGVVCIFGLIYTHTSIQNLEIFISKVLDLKKLDNDANVMINSDFKVTDLSVLNEKILEIMDMIAQKRGTILSGGRIDYEKISCMVRPVDAAACLGFRLRSRSGKEAGGLAMQDLRLCIRGREPSRGFRVPAVQTRSRRF